ncbi:TRAP-T-associated universal stress protein TeaD [Aquicella siphonis]|uniref:TRAP-T-associated universal stress protein TeaD n=1 Tax=Aquicella siphonis TaxID=254247 RepID=A0A5E4PLN4_9COXI|nr:universal stress protein [Aquicella siphonis]VVC77136.1 TRAP-T-associated universal stress protein TeaD [Aquicella siphonis]
MSRDQSILKKILVATDFSETSGYAIKRAMEMAKAAHADLTILHVVKSQPVNSFLHKNLKKILPERFLLLTKEKINAMIRLQAAKWTVPGLKVNYTIINTGNPATRILKYSRKNKVNLIVMGAHGTYSIHDSFVGTTAEYIAEKTFCPVLIVKKSPRKPYKKILVPVDFSDTSKNALVYACRSFPKADLRLFHAGDYEYENILMREKKEEQVPEKKIASIRKAILFYLENKMKDFIRHCRKTSVKLPYRITLGYPGPTIINAADQFRSDLILMGTQGHGQMHYDFKGSVANRVLTEANKDILLVPPAKR